MKTRHIITILLTLLIVALVVVLYRSIMQPVKFESEFNQRKDIVVERLKRLRTMEETYRFANGKYCGNLDSLILFAQKDSVKVLKKFGTLPDNMTEAEALKQGILRREVVWVPAYENILERDTNFTTAKENLEELKYIPFTDPKELFQIGASNVDRGGVIVPVFEIKADFAQFLKDLDEQTVLNKIAEVEKANKYPGWKVGDLTQPIVDGNWE